SLSCRTSDRHPGHSRDARYPRGYPGTWMRLVTESATAARTTLDAAVGQIGRVEQLVELFRREVRHLGRDILDPPILPVGSLGNLRAEIVADDRVQRGDHDRILVDEVGNVLRVDGET